MILVSEKKAFEKDGEHIEYVQYSLLCENGKKIAIKPVYKNERSLLNFLASSQELKENNEDFTQDV